MKYKHCNSLLTKIATTIVISGISTIAFANEDTNRLNLGVYSGTGLQFETDSKDSLGHLEVGVYSLLSPIKNSLDIQASVSATAMTKTLPSFGETEDNNDVLGYKVSAYAGPVFLYSDGDKGIGVGVLKNLYFEDIPIKKHKIGDGIGAYVELQLRNGLKTKYFDSSMPFVRISAEKVDIEASNSRKADKQTWVGITAGLKSWR